MAQTMWFLAFHKVTDYWGPIPYFQAGIPANTVPYDAQDKIYDDFFAKLDSANTILKATAGENHVGSYDLFYGGDVNKWIKLNNSLRLRLAIRISKVNPDKAKTEAETAFAGG